MLKYTCAAPATSASSSSSAAASAAGGVIDLSELVKPLVACLSDKTADLRQKAEAIVVDYMCAHSASASAAVRDEIGTLQKAQQLQLQPIVDRLGGGGGKAAAAASSSSSAAASASTAKPSGLVRPGSAMGAASSSASAAASSSKLELKRPGTASAAAAAAPGTWYIGGI
jgi:hypothetical protein